MDKQNSRIPDSERAHSVLLGAISGAAVGIVAGLLLAPKKGTELRADLVRSAGRVRDRAARAYAGVHRFMPHAVPSRRGGEDASASH